jgi:hypothetical protein
MGENNVRVESNGLVDEALIVRVEKEHKEYSFVGSGAGVVNWFDKDGKQLEFTYNEGYYSVQDNMGELFAHPEAAKVVQEFSALIYVFDFAYRLKKCKNLFSFSRFHIISCFFTHMSFFT